MNWVLLIIAGLFEVGFTACLGKAKESIWRLFFITTLIVSIFGLKIVSN